MSINAEQREFYYLILIFLVLAAGIILAGNLYYQSYEQEYRSEVENQLTSVGDLKVNGLISWRSERIGDAQVFVQNNIFSSQVSEIQHNPSNTTVTRDLLNWLSNVKTQYHYNRIYLLSPQGKMVLSVPNPPDSVSSRVLLELSSVLEKREIRVIDFYNDEYDQKVYLTILVPIFDHENKSKQLGVLVFQIDPEEYLYPFISKWPVPSSSAETLLLRREGDTVLYLNKLRFRPDPPLSLRLSLNQTNLPAMKAVMGQEGIVEGIDYRGVPVIANIRNIPDSPWFMEAKIDPSEVFQPLQTRALEMIFIELLLLFGTGAVLYLFRKRESARLSRDLYGIKESLRESEERLRFSLDAANDAIWDWNIPTGTTIFGPRWFTMLGYEPDELPPTYDTWRSLLHPDDLNRAEEKIMDCIHKKDRGYTVEFRMQTKSGGWCWILSRGKIVGWDTDGNPDRMVGTHTDITTLKQAQEHLKESEGRLQTLIHAIPDLVWLKDRDGVYLACNTMFERFIGAKEGDLIGKSDYDFFEKEVAASFREYDRRAIDASRSLVNEEWITFADDGHRSLLETIKTPLFDTQGTLIGVLGIGRDITARKSIEDQITIQNQRLEQAQAVGHLGSWEFDLNTGNIWGSNEGFHIYGMIPPPDNKLPIHEIESCIPERERVHQALIDLIEGKSPYNLEFAIHPADGSPERTIISIAEIITDESGTPLKVVGVIHDVTSRKKAEIERDELILKLSQKNELLNIAYEAIAGSEEELRVQYSNLAVTESQLRETTNYLENLITVANVPIIVWDAAYIITRVNHALENLVGRSADLLIGQSIGTIFPKDLVQHSMRLIETTKAGVRWDTVELAVLHQDGTIKTVLWNSATLYSPDGQIPIATIAQGQDITQRKRLEDDNDAALKQIQKNLAQLSILNDEIRNPLMIILMSADMGYDERNRNLIAEQIRRIDDMVNQLDSRWMESEKVLTMIRTNYQIFASPSSDQIIRDIEEKSRGRDISGDRARLEGSLVSSIAEVVKAELYTILDSIDAYIFVADLQTYELLYLNRQGRSLFGDMAGKKCFEIVQKDHRKPCPFCTIHLLTDDFGPTGVHQHEIKNTLNGRWYDCRDQVIRWSDGRFVHLQVGTDITRRKTFEDALKENEYTFRKLYEESSDSILLMQDDRFLECNQAALDLLGIPVKEELIGLTPMDISPEYQPDGRLSVDTAPEYINHAHREGHCRFEWMVRRGDGTPILLEVSLIPIMFKGEEMLHITWRDVTERKAAEEKLFKTNLLLDCITQSQAQFFIDGDPMSVFVTVLDQLLKLTQSEHGFIAETLYDEKDIPYITDVIISNAEWDWTSVEKHETVALPGRESDTLKALISTVVALGTVVISNDPVHDTQRGSLLKRDSPIHTFLGVPILKEGKQVGFFFIANRPGGYDDIFVNYIQPFTDALSNLIEFIREVRKRKIVERALSKSEEKYRSLFDNAILGIFRTTPKGEYLDMNAAFARIAGYGSPQEMMAVIHDIEKQLYVRPLDRQEIAELLMRNGEVRNFETEIRHRDGHSIWIAINATSVRDENGSIISWDGTIEEITVRKLTEEELARKNEELNAAYEQMAATSEELRLNYEELAKAGEALQESSRRYRELFENSRDGFVVMDIQGRFLDANEAYCEMLGYNLEELKNKDNHYAITPEKWHQWEYNEVWVNRLQKDGVSGVYEKEYIRKNGTVFPVVLQFFTVKDELGNISYLWGIARDITDRRNGENALRDSQGRLKAFIDNMTSSIGIFDENLILVEINTFGAKWWQGRRKYEMIGRHITELILDVDELLLEQLQDVIQTGQRFIDHQHINSPQFGALILEIEAFRIPGGVAIITTDITERRKAVEQLRESEEKYRKLSDFLSTIYDNSELSIFVVKVKGPGLYEYEGVNKTYETLFGIEKDEIVGKKPEDLLHLFGESTIQYVRNLYDHCVNLKQVEESEFELNISGNTEWWLSKLTPVADPNGSIYRLIGASVKITDRKRMENELRNAYEKIKTSEQGLLLAQKKLNLLSSITRHDINNQLTVIQVYADVLQETQPDSTIADQIRSMVTAVERISSMIQFTKEYEYIGVNAPVWQDCRNLVTSAANQALTTHIMVQNCIPAGTSVFADPLIIRVFYNLIENAVRYGGKVTTIRFYVEETGGSNIIVCEDDGDGIPAEEKQMIFEHGYGKNTGMGLFLAREVLSITDISIRECGIPGQGSRFEILVPEGMFSMNPDNPDNSSPVPDE
ncbi:MAG TPA: PAS domain S-box protein [Methanospirillum sp.]|nr:PAS domain S-box protein [Methanospirillum sp.]